MAKGDQRVGLFILLTLVVLASRGAADEEEKPPAVVREARVTFDGLFAEVQGA